MKVIEVKEVGVKHTFLGATLFFLVPFYMNKHNLKRLS